jgi:hypothetical protein
MQLSGKDFQSAVWREVRQKNGRDRKIETPDCVGSNGKDGTRFHTKTQSHGEFQLEKTMVIS